MYEPLLPRNGLSVFSNDDAMSYDLRFFIRDDIWIFLLEGFQTYLVTSVLQFC